MIEIELTGWALGRVRFVPDPLWETIASLSVLQLPEGEAVHGRLASLLETVPPHSMQLLGQLCGDPRWFPDFLLPEPQPGRFASPLEAVLRVGEASLEVVERDLQVVARYVPDSSILTMDPGHLRDQATEALRDYWAAVVAPLWGRLEALDLADIAYRSRYIASHGVIATLDALYARISLADNVLRIDTPLRRRVARASGLWLVPSVFRWPRIAVQYATEVPVIGYSTRGGGLLWDEVRQGSPGLDRLIGRTRALVLDRADLPVTTAQLAASLQLARPTVNQHLKALEAAGLMVARRRGKEVLYERTAMGDQLLTAPR